MEPEIDDIQKKIEQRISELPTDVQDAIFSVDFGQKINSIGTAAKLHIDQTQRLSESTMAVMLGFMNEEEYRKEVSEITQGNEEVTEKILSEVNQNVFLSIRASMKAFSEKSTETQVPTPAESLPVQEIPSAVTPPKVDMHPADVLLAEKSIVSVPQVAPKPQVPDTMAAPKPAMPNVEPPKPQDYKADPYREPTN